jgi:hypothetical protein
MGVAAAIAAGPAERLRPAEMGQGKGGVGFYSPGICRQRGIPVQAPVEPLTLQVRAKGLKRVGGKLGKSEIGNRLLGAPYIAEQSDTEPVHHAQYTVGRAVHLGPSQLLAVDAVNIRCQPYPTTSAYGAAH